MAAATPSKILRLTSWSGLAGKENDFRVDLLAFRWSHSFQSEISLYHNLQSCIPRVEMKDDLHG